LTSTQPGNPFARIFKPDPFREIFRALADSLDSAVLVISWDASQILACNHAFLLLTAYARSELEALSPQSLFADPQPGQTLKRVLECQEKHEARLSDVPLLARDGTPIPVDLRIRSIAAGQGAFLLTLIPASAQQRQQEMRESVEKGFDDLAQLSRILLQSDTEAVSSFLDMARNFLHATHVGLYRVSHAEPGYQLVGSLPEEFPASLSISQLRPFPRTSTWSLGKRPDHPLQKAARAAGMQALYVSGIGTENAWVAAVAALWHDKSAVPANIDALMTILCNLGHAILQIGLQQAAIADLENGITALEKELQIQSGTMTEALLALDDDLRVVRVNPAAESMLGYQAGELVGSPVQDVLVSPEDLVATLLDALGHQRLAERSRLIIHRRDGTPFPIHLRAVPTARKRGLSLLLVINDLSERQAIEDQKEILAQRALLGDVSAIFAHEVRNPINNISTGVQLVASRLGEEHKLYPSLERIRKECTRLDQLMSDVLFFARPLELKIEPTQIAELLDRILSRWEPRIRQAKVSLHRDFAPQAPLADVDPRTFEQVIVNLISNALEAMPEGGSLSISLAPAPSNGGMLEIIVADTGTGIPPDVLERIFDPFFTTKKEGTGLGLAITRRIITAHRGMISAESFPDAGTIFTIRIPCSQR
jgi:PAS domain S-box-containing protein